MAATPGEHGGGEETRRRLVAAAVETLRTDGFAAASARTIAAGAQVNQALAFYHFGSVHGLLLAALDAVSEQRLSAYSTALADVHTLPELIDVARTIFATDLDSGNVRVLVEMIVGSMGYPELSVQVAARLQPWKDFAADALRSTLADSPAADLVSAEEAAHVTVALYLGMETLAGLEGSRETALALFDRARLGAALLALSRSNPFGSPS